MSGDPGRGERLPTVGVLGGMSSEATREYYRLLDEGVNDELGGHAAAEVLIRSVDFADVERFIRTERWEEAGAYLADAARDLEAGGADFVIMATNTMHRVAPRIVEELSIPFLHIIDVTADAIDDAGIGTVGLLGTRTTMEAPFYRDRFAERGIEVVVPDEGDRERVDEVIFGELTAGVVREESREEYLAIIDDLVGRGAGGIVLGCTEIELLIGPDDVGDVPLFDTTALHVERAVERCLCAGDRP